MQYFTSLQDIAGGDAGGGNNEMDVAGASRQPGTSRQAGRTGGNDAMDAAETSCQPVASRQAGRTG